MVSFSFRGSGSWDYSMDSQWALERRSRPQCTTFEAFYHEIILLNIALNARWRSSHMSVYTGMMDRQEGSSEDALERQDLEFLVNLQISRNNQGDIVECQLYGRFSDRQDEPQPHTIFTSHPFHPQCFQSSILCRQSQREQWRKKILQTLQVRLHHHLACPRDGKSAPLKWKPVRVDARG